MFFFFFQQVENFVEELFQYLKIEYQREVSVENRRIDFILKSSDSFDTLVEVKGIRNNQNNVVFSAVNQIKYYRNLYKKANKFSFVIIFTDISKKLKEEFFKEDIIVIDIANILYLIKDSEELNEKLKNILPYSIIDIIPEEIDLEKYINYTDNPKNENSIKIEDKLIQEIKAIEKGKKGSREFEIVGEKIVKLLFGDYIYDWKAQLNCNKNMYRIDLVGKIKQQEGFWKILYDFYKSRYVVFEFKNYNDKITQQQIYTTNKYLYKVALRTVAIVISRESIDENAKKMCEGIFREEEKLILTLSETDLINMLNLRKQNSSKDICSEYMEKIFDNFLMELEK